MENKIKPKKIYYFSSTHWDREWYKTFQQFRVRLVDTIDGVMETLEKNKEFTHFTMDGQTSVLDDYVEIMPKNRARLKKLISDGRISVGPWYTQPDEYLLSGESIIQNLLYGHKKSEEFGATAMKYGYVPDTFGHIAQLPQIFRGFGIESALVGRGVCDGTFPAFFMWESPDKSQCSTYKVSEILGYGSFRPVMKGYLRSPNQPEEKNTSKAALEDDVALKRACEFIEEEMERTHLPFVILMDGLDHMPIHVNAVKIAKRISEYYDCPVVFDSLEELAKDIKEYENTLTVKVGELNKTGKSIREFTETIRYTLSSRYDIKKANDTAQNLLEKWMLPLSAIARLNGINIPRGYEEVAYKNMLLNHAHDSICGCSIDEVHQDMNNRFKQVNEIAEEITAKAIVSLMKVDIKASTEKQQFLRVFNPLFTERDETITAEIIFEPGNSMYKYRDSHFSLYDINAFKLKDINDNEIPYQIVKVNKNSFYKIPTGMQNQKKDVYTIIFNAKLPANSYAQYFIVPSNTPVRYLERMEKERLEAENEYISLKINENGTFNIYDKKTERTYSQLNSFIDNSDIGDGWRHTPSIEDVFCYSDGAGRRIEKINDGPNSVTFKVTNILEIPVSAKVSANSWGRSEEYTKLEIASFITLGSRNRWVDVKTVVNNKASDHRLKVLLPTGIKNIGYYASQAFAFVKRSTGSNLDSGEWMEFDKPENNFEGIVLKKDDEGRGLAFISAYGLHECEAKTDKKGTLAVTLLRAIGHTAFTDGQPDGQLQGSHTYEYRLLTFSGDDTFGDMVVIKDRLRAGIKNITAYFDASAAAEDIGKQKGFSLISRNIVISSMKSAEDNDHSIIVRICNYSDEASSGEFISPYDIKAVSETDLLENIKEKIDFNSKSIVFKAEPWQIKTYRIDFDMVIEESPLDQ